MFNSSEEDRLGDDLTLLRARENDAEAMRNFLFAPAASESPSLLSSRTLAQKVTAS